MNRRKFVSSTLKALSGAVFIFSGYSLVKGRGTTSICLIDIQFPRNKDLDQFVLDRPLWMDSNQYEKVVSEFRGRGLLLKKERTLGSTSVQMTYHFRDRESHDLFVRIIDSMRIVDDAALQRLGYQYRRLYA